MLRSLKNLRGYTIHAVDGNIGKVDDFYFDDQAWTVRYLVADTGSWLVGRRVLLSTAALGRPKWERQTFPVTLTREQVEHSPPIAANRPVSRRMEQELHAYYGWPPYWSGAGALVAQVAAQMEAEREESAAGGRFDDHLRSTREVIGSHIQATDGQVGHVEDFIADDERWVVRYAIVDTGNWLSGRRVLLAPAWITEVSWPESKVYMDLDRRTIENSPEFDPSAPVNREYELRLYDYYGRPRYWTSV